MNFRTSEPVGEISARRAWPTRGRWSRVGQKLVIDLRGGPGRRVEPVDEELRQSSTCSAPGTLPFGETFDPYGRGPVYSLPFHAAKGRTIHVDVSAQFESSTRSDKIDHTFGVEVFQCCVVSDERLAPQTTEVIGPAGSPRHISLDVTVSDACSWSQHEGSDLVYYLRIYNASQGERVIIAYSVR